MKASYQPELDAFCRAVLEHPGTTVVPVLRRLTSDTLTPVTAFLQLDDGKEAFLFESVIGGERVGRYSFVGSGPFLHFEAYDRHVHLAGQLPPLAGGDQELSRLQAEVARALDPLAALQVLLQRFRAPHLPGLPRFCGGAVGYVGYDAVRYTEHLPHVPPDDRQLPDLAFGLYDQMVVFDHIQKTILAVAHAHVPVSLPASRRRSEQLLRKAYTSAVRRLNALVRRLSRPLRWAPLADVPGQLPLVQDYQSNFPREAFEAAVRRCQEYIRAGDIFQVVISQRLATATSATPLDIYRALRMVNPSPFMFLLRTGPTCLVGSSPEIMVRVEDDLVTTRPLAGTRPRGKTDAEDLALERELLADQKERAEHVMLVDLGRNDVGRVCQPGTVRVSDLMTVERYSHVMHITSHVTGRLRPGLTALDALRACLPAGTVSGAPKVRAMEIIDELEPHKRGPYAGAVGYADFTGNMDTCIALRTMVVQGTTVYIQAGAGIVYDSVPSREYEETLNKAMGLLKAIALAEAYLTPLQHRRRRPQRSSLKS
jgi:anthranilate synthase component 1